MDGIWLTNRQPWWEQVDNMLIEVHLSETCGGANYYAISLIQP